MRRWNVPGGVVLALAALTALLVSCSNGEGTSSSTGATTGRTAAPPSTAEVRPPAEEAVQVQHAQALLDRLARQDFADAEAGFDQTMRQQLPETKLREVWTGLVAQAGEYQETTGSRVTTQGAYTVVVLTAVFVQTPLDVTVSFDEAGRVAGLFFSAASTSSTGSSGDSGSQAPTYVRRDAFTERDVTVGSGEWTLPGTLSMPKGAGPFPAVVLVHGSGPNDRDETIGPNKPFRDLAWGLASKGIAVLRYDKRTKVYAARLAADADLTVQQETVDDAAAAARLLRASTAVDPRRVFLLGHSLGGMLAPRIARREPSPAGLVILAGTARPLEDVILEQVRYLASLPGQAAGAGQGQVRELEAKVARVKDPGLSKTTPAAGLPLGIPAAYWLDLRSYRPAEVAATLPQPMLILQGGRDYQVTGADLAVWKQALASRPNVTTRLYPDLNHLFMSGTGMSTPQEYQRTGHVDQRVVADIAAFIAAGR